MENASTDEIAIVGFGAGGLSLFIQLIDAALANSRKISITVFEKNIPAKGIAYNTHSVQERLNFDARLMNATHQVKNEFFIWFKNNRTLWQKYYPNIDINDLYPPRGIFGMYLEEKFYEYSQKMRNAGMHLEIVNSEVIDIQSDDNQAILTDNKDNCFTFTNVILAIGNLPSQNYRNLSNTPGYYHSRDNVEINGTGPITVIGTGLSAIDIVLKLKIEQKIPNKIYMVSRQGVLPKVASTYSHYELEFAREEQLQNIISMQKDVENKLSEAVTREFNKALSNQKIKIEEGDATKILKVDIDNAKKHASIKWQMVLIAIYPYMHRIWSQLDIVARANLLNKYHGLWQRYFYSFPSVSAEKLLYLLENKSVIVSSLKSIIYSAESKHYEVVISHNCFNSRIIIDASGSSYDVNSSKLLKKMVQNKLIKRTVIGDIPINVLNCKVLSDNSLNFRLYAIGQLTIGSWLTVADLNQISMQASLVVKDIFAKS